MPSTPSAMKIVLAREGHTVETGARIAAGLSLREPTGGTDRGSADEMLRKAGYHQA